jgi:excisionase family DNA binding protein
MSLEHDANRQRARGSKPMARTALTVSEWCESTGISRPTAYRMMKDGELRFVQIRLTRRIPVEESIRLGFTSLQTA